MSTNIERLAIIGKGNQALAWAHNLKKSNTPYSIGVRSLSALDHPNFLLGEELEKFNKIALLIPDEQHIAFLDRYAPFIQQNTKIIYAHGYSIFYHKLNEKFPQFQHILFAPKSIAQQIIENNLKGKSTAVYCSLEHAHENFKPELEKLAHQLGFFIASYGTFKEEVIADLFSEQSLLCGLYPFMIHEVFEILKKNGVNKDLSFLECWHESKLIMDTLVEKGPVEFFKMISPNALQGAMDASKVLFDDHFKNKLEQIYKNIESGGFEENARTQNHNSNLKKMNSFWEQTDLQKTYDSYKGQLYQ